MPRGGSLGKAWPRITTVPFLGFILGFDFFFLRFLLLPDIPDGESFSAISDSNDANRTSTVIGNTKTRQSASLSTNMVLQRIPPRKRLYSPNRRMQNRISSMGKLAFKNTTYVHGQILE